jgi:hypothetical protein
LERALPENHKSTALPFADRYYLFAAELSKLAPRQDSQMLKELLTRRTSGQKIARFFAVAEGYLRTDELAFAHCYAGD